MSNLILPLGILAIREGTILREGTWSDWLPLDSLRKREGAALGFIPKAVYESVLTRTRVANRDRWKYQDVLVTEDNADFTGFCMTTYAKELANIFQIVVRPDARRWHRALLMLDSIEEKARRLGKAGVTCRVAQDLESNMFWLGTGYSVVNTVTSSWLNQHESQSARQLFVYEKRFQ